MSSPRERPAPTFEHIDVWLFDLDNTLYPASCNLLEQMKQQVRALMCDRLGLSYEQAAALHQRFIGEYGTALRGLRERHDIDADTFFAWIHDVNYSVVAPRPELGAALAKLDGRKLVFTNGAEDHAERVLARLGCRAHFESIFDIAAAGYESKPQPAPYRQLLAHLGVDASRVGFVDDVPQNLEPAAALGMTTVWMRTDSEFSRHGHIGAHVQHVTDDLVAWLEEICAARIANAAASA